MRDYESTYRTISVLYRMLNENGIEGVYLCML